MGKRIRLSALGNRYNDIKRLENILGREKNNIEELMIKNKELEEDYMRMTKENNKKHIEGK